MPCPTCPFGPSSLGLTVSMTNSPAHAAVISWNSAPNSANYVYFKSSLAATNWQLLTNFATGPVAGRMRVTDPATPVGRMYRVRVDAP